MFCQESLLIHHRVLHKSFISSKERQKIKKKGERCTNLMVKSSMYLPCVQIEETGDSYNMRHRVLLLEVVVYKPTQLHTYIKKIQ